MAKGLGNRRLDRRVLAVLVGVSVLATAATACASGSGADRTSAVLASVPPIKDLGGQQPKGIYVGRVQGTPALVAIVADKDDVVAYVCDGDKTVGWLSGKERGGTFALERGSLHVDGRLESGSFAGMVTVADGSQHAFRAAPAMAGFSGLYRSVVTVDGQRAQAGWILFDRELRGATKGSSFEGEGLATTLPSDSGSTATTTVAGGNSGSTGGGSSGTLQPRTCGEYNDQIDNWFTFLRGAVAEQQKAKSKDVKDQLQAMIDDAILQISSLQIAAHSAGCKDVH